MVAWDLKNFKVKFEWKQALNYSLTTVFSKSINIYPALETARN